MQLHAICDDCRHKHLIEFDPQIGPGSAFSDWLTKHPNHRIDFKFPQRSYKKPPPEHPWLDYISNADIKTAYAASAGASITLASLAASSTLLAGRESTAVDNGASNKYLDYLCAGFYKGAATNLQAGTIQTAIVGNIDDTPTWPDVFDGTDSTETVTIQAMYDQVCRIISSIATDATARTWPWGPTAMASLFGGVVPDQFVFFVSHSAHTSTNAWSATESDHGIKITGVYATAV